MFIKNRLLVFRLISFKLLKARLQQVGYTQQKPKKSRAYRFNPKPIKNGRTALISLLKHIAIAVSLLENLIQLNSLSCSRVQSIQAKSRQVRGQERFVQIPRIYSNFWANEQQKTHTLLYIQWCNSEEELALGLEDPSFVSTDSCATLVKYLKFGFTKTGFKKSPPAAVPRSLLHKLMSGMDVPSWNWLCNEKTVL